MNAIGAHVSRGHHQQAARQENDQLRTQLVEVITGYFDWCPLCGGSVLFHDDEACETKMANWKPLGILNVDTGSS